MPTVINLHLVAYTMHSPPVSDSLLGLLMLVYMVSIFFSTLIPQAYDKAHDAGHDLEVVYVPVADSPEVGGTVEDNDTHRFVYYFQYTLREWRFGGEIRQRRVL